MNGYFLCDRGRFGYGFVNDAHRPRTPMLRDGTGLASAAPKDVVLEKLAALRGKKIIGIGSPRASLEANFALRELVGADAFFPGIAAAGSGVPGGNAEIYRAGMPPARLAEIETADAVLVLGEDVANTAPRLALALRQAVRHRRAGRRRAAENRPMAGCSDPQGGAGGTRAAVHRLALRNAARRHRPKLHAARHAGWICRFCPRAP